MPTTALPQRQTAHRLGMAAAVFVTLMAAPGCGSWRQASTGGTGQWNASTCADCGDADCNAGFCLCTRRYVRCWDEKQAVHDAIARANIAMRRDYAMKPSLDVRAGYRDAFIDVALGASGAVPPVPPERYWNVCYRTANGHAKAADWFAGYRAGACRALATCRQVYNAVPTSGEGGFMTGPADHPIDHSPYFGTPAPAGW